MSRTILLVGGLVLFALWARPSAGEEALPVGPEFQVSRGHGTDYGNYTYDGYAYGADVARTPGGDFVVVWEELVQNYQGYDYTNAYRLAGRRMHHNGTGAGDQFKIYQQSDEYQFG